MNYIEFIFSDQFFEIQILFFCTFFIQFSFFFRFIGPIIAASIFIFKFAVYWKMQFISAGIVTGMEY